MGASLLLSLLCVLLYLQDGRSFVGRAPPGHFATQRQSVWQYGQSFAGRILPSPATSQSCLSALITALYMSDDPKGFSRGGEAPVNKNRAKKPKKTAQRPQQRVETITSKNTHLPSPDAPKYTASDPYAPCACGSKLEYKACCGIQHMTTPAVNTPESVLRARYTAFATANADYIIASSHPQNDDYQRFMVEARASKRTGTDRWRRDILSAHAAAKLDYLGLAVTHTEVKAGTAEVTFRALFIAEGRDDEHAGGAASTRATAESGDDHDYIAVEEKATFVKSGERWYFLSGVTAAADEDAAEAMIRDWGRGGTPAMAAGAETAAGAAKRIPGILTRGKKMDPSLPVPVAQGGGKDQGLTSGSGMGNRSPAYGNPSKRHQASGGLNDKANILPFASGRA